MHKYTQTTHKHPNVYTQNRTHTHTFSLTHKQVCTQTQSQARTHVYTTTMWDSNLRPILQEVVLAIAVPGSYCSVCNCHKCEFCFQEGISPRNSSKTFAGQIRLLLNKRRVSHCSSRCASLDCSLNPSNSFSPFTECKPFRVLECSRVWCNN